MGHSIAESEVNLRGETRRIRCSSFARAAPNKLTTNLTLSSAERRRLPARAGATVSVAREQDLTRAV
jgi:hypothetical protein